MAAHNENNESKQQDWDMEFMDPFSLEEDEDDSRVCYSGAIQTSAETARNVPVSHLATETLNDALVQRVNTVMTSTLQTVTHLTATTDVEFPDLNQNSQHHQSHVVANTGPSRTTLSTDESRQCVNESVASCGKKSSHDINVESHSSSEVTSASSDEQSPIPVMLSTKRFCASPVEDIEMNQPVKRFSAYPDLPSPSVILSNSPIHFARPAYPPAAYNIPTWPTVSLPLPLSNSVTGLRVPQVVPYNCVPYCAILPHSANIPVLYNQSSPRVVDGSGAAHWPGTRLNLQNILTKPPPPLPIVSCAARDFASLQTVPLPHLRNGLTSPRLPLATVPQVIPPLPPPTINRLPFSTSTHSVLLPQHQPRIIAASRIDKSDLPLVSSVSISTSHCQPQCDSIAPRHPTPVSPVSNNADPSDVVTSSALLKRTINNTEHNNNYVMPKTLPTEQLRPTLAVTDKSSLTVASNGVANVRPPSTSSEFASKQTITVATSYSSIPPPPAPVKFSSTFAQLDPRIHNGNRQNSGTSAQSRSSADASSTQSSAFVVPVPPPLPSLEELNADTSDDPRQKDDKVPTVGLTSQSTASETLTMDSAQLDRVLITVSCSC